MTQVVVTGPADADLAEILGYLHSAAGQSIVFKYKDLLKASCGNSQIIPKVVHLVLYLGQAFDQGMCLLMSFFIDTAESKIWSGSSASSTVNAVLPANY